MIALGTGGIKPCVSAFGGDQFKEGQTDNLRRFFSLFYFSINAGSVVSTLLTPVLRSESHTCTHTPSHAHAHTHTHTLTHTHTHTHTHGQITFYLFVHRSTYKERGVDVIARSAYMLKHGTEKY